MTLKFAASNNILATNAGSVASSAERAVRCRIPFYIGSGSLSNIVLSFQGFYVTASSAPNYANSYSIVKAAIEKDGNASSVPVYFGGVRNKTVNPGDVDIKSDAVLPSSFSLGSFGRDELYWLRLEYSVVNATDILPGGNLHYDIYGYPGSVGLRIDTGTYAGGAVDSYGVLSIGGSGWSEFALPMVPFVLGTHTSGAAAKKTFILIGDSITSGLSGDGAATNTKGMRGMTRGLADTGRTTGHYGGANFGVGSADATLWTGASGAKLTPFLPYAGYAFEEFGVNLYPGAPGASAATAVAQSRVIWDACAAVSTDVLRLKLLPYTTSDGVTAIHSAFQSGGNARAFNVALESEVGITVVARNSLRVSATEGTDGFYQWAGTTTNQSDGLHPNAAGVLLDAIDLRAVIAALPDVAATISTITGTTATEASAVVFTVTMSGTGGLTGAYSWSGTATSADYTQTLTNGMFTTTGGSGSVTVSGGNIVVPSAVTAFEVAVPTTTDTLDEADETIRLVFGGVTSSSGTINDDDAAPTITGTTSQTVTAGSPVVITYSPGLSGQTRTYTLALTDGTATGGTDYDNTTVTGDFAVTAGTGSVAYSAGTVTVDPGVTEFTLSIGTTA
jgi:hypothetical protein